jgi:hypothetical protein
MQTNTTQTQSKELLGQVRDKIRFKYFSLGTEQTISPELNSSFCIIKSIILLKWAHSRLGALLTYPASQRHVSILSREGVVGKYLRFRVKDVAPGCRKIY